MFRFHAENIVNKALQKVTKKLAEHDVKVKLKISDQKSNQPCPNDDCSMAPLRK